MFVNVDRHAELLNLVGRPDELAAIVDPRAWVLGKGSLTPGSIPNLFDDDWLNWDRADSQLPCVSDMNPSEGQDRLHHIDRHRHCRYPGPGTG